MTRRRHAGCNAQAALETALVIPILLLLVCNFVAVMVEVSVQQQLDSATALAAESRFQASETAYDPAGATCCPDPRCCAEPVQPDSLQTGGLPTGCRYAAESFYGTMRSFGAMLRWQSAPLCLSGGNSAGAASTPYPGAPSNAHVSCVVGSVDPRGVVHQAFLDLTLAPPRGLYVVTCDATATVQFSSTPLAWGVFWSPTLHAHAEALPPPFRQ
ncbi:MAG TPA: hypothetical protein VFA70_04195 [Dehalococcoidia bacterium]|nr:hypothetical protein [Dehalococcoidia bacterium]